MNKKTKVKTTLDKKHKDKVSSFENLNNEKNKILTRIDAINKKIEKINSLDYNDYSQNIVLIVWRKTSYQRKDLQMILQNMKKRYIDGCE